jgi:hypothetical protein
MAHLAEPLMKKGGTLFTMTYDGSQMVVDQRIGAVLAQEQRIVAGDPVLQGHETGAVFASLDLRPERRPIGAR